MVWKKQIIIIIAVISSIVFLSELNSKSQKTVSPIIILKHSKNPVGSLAWSIDGKRIVGGTESGIAQVWDIETRQVLANLKSKGRVVTYVGWSPDGTKLAVTNSDGITTIWNNSWQLLESFSNTANNVYTMGWNAKSNKIAISDFNNFIRFWDIDSSQELSIPQKHFYKMVAWNPHEDMLAVADANNEIDLFNGETGKEITSFEGHDDKVSAISWNSKGDVLATGSIDNTIKLWRIDTGNSIASFDAIGDVLQLAWSPDGNKVVSLSDKNEIRIWNVNEKKLQGSLVVNSEKIIQDGSLVWNPDGKYVAFYRGFPSGVWSGNAWVIDVKTSQILYKIENPSPFTSIAWNPDGTMLAISDSDNIQIWNTSDLVNPL